MQKAAFKDISINLVPHKSQTSVSSFLSRSLLFAELSLVSLGIILIIALLFYTKLIWDFNTSFRNVRDNLNGIKANPQMEEKVNEIASRLKYIKDVKKLPDPNISAVDSLGQIIPPGFTLTSLKIDKNKLSISGQLLNPIIISQFSNLVKKGGGMSNFTVTQIAVPTSRSPYYTISATIDISGSEANNWKYLKRYLIK